MKLAGVILAGGRGERLGGVNKALLEIGSERFIDRAVAALAGCSPLLVAVGREAFDLPTGTVPIFDIAADYAGPLAGLAAAVDALADSDVEVLASLAVDTPLFPSDFVARALPLLSRGAVMASFGMQDYPTNTLWRFEAIRGLADEVRAGTAPRSLKRLAARVEAQRLDYAGILADDPFRNANTPEDLSFLRAAAGRPPHG